MPALPCAHGSGMGMGRVVPPGDLALHDRSARSESAVTEKEPGPLQEQAPPLNRFRSPIADPHQDDLAAGISATTVEPTTVARDRLSDCAGSSTEDENFVRRPAPNGQVKSPCPEVWAVGAT